jgi:hypothetical protein
MEQRKANDKDLFELTRGEINAVLAYLGKRPAEEVFALVSILLSKAPSKLVETEEAVTPVLEASASEAAGTEEQAVAQ